MKKAKFFLLLSIVLIFSCNHKVKDGSKVNDTILHKSDLYFSSIDWTNSESIVAEPMPEPFSIEVIKKNKIALYSDTNIQESIFPEMDGLGTLDYSGIDASLLNFLNKVVDKVKIKKINKGLCFNDKGFLPFLIDYRLKRLGDIASVYFSRPEYKENKKAVTKLRCNIKSSSTNENMTNIFIEITVIFAEEKWFIDSFDIIGEYDASSIEQN